MSRKAFWPGYDWRILAHKPQGLAGAAEKGWWLCRYCGWKGQNLAKHPKRCEGKLGSYDFDRHRPDYTREIVHSGAVEVTSEDFAEPVEFDELVIDNWFHLEQMNARDWWLGLGNGDDYWHINVHVDRDGKASVSMEKQ